jgi:hypothetical protein
MKKDSEEIRLLIIDFLQLKHCFDMKIEERDTEIFVSFKIREK